MRPRLGPILIVAVAGLVVVGLLARGEGTRRPICAAQDSLRVAIRAVDAARAAERSGDAAAVTAELDEIARLLSEARGHLVGPASDPETAAAARAMQEASNYLQFIVDDARASGAVDDPIAQFAARELNRAGAGAGGSPLNC